MAPHPETAAIGTSRAEANPEAPTKAPAVSKTCRPAAGCIVGRRYVTRPFILAIQPTPIILSHLAVLHLTRPRLTTHLRHPLDLSEKALEASTPREEQKSLLLTANPHGDRNNPDDARGDARARAARKVG